MITGSIHARVERTISPEQRHQRLCDFMADQPDPWRGRAPFPSISFGVNDVCYAGSFGKSAPSGVALREMLLLRQERLYVQDDSGSDDQLTIEVSRKVKIIDFLDKFLIGTLAAFSAYRCCFSSKSYREWREANPKGNTGEVVNSRRRVSFIGLINFWDRQLCLRSWGLVPEEVRQRLEGNVEKALMVHGGILSVVSSVPIPLEREIEIDQRIRNRLVPSTDG